MKDVSNKLFIFAAFIVFLYGAIYFFIPDNFGKDFLIKIIDSILNGLVFAAVVAYFGVKVQSKWEDEIEEKRKAKELKLFKKLINQVFSRYKS